MARNAIGIGAAISEGNSRTVDTAVDEGAGHKGCRSGGIQLRILVDWDEPSGTWWLVPFRVWHSALGNEKALELLAAKMRISRVPIRLPGGQCCRGRFIRK
jgi:hypothetical protein